MKNDHIATFSIHNLVFTCYLPAASLSAENYSHLVPGCLSLLPVSEVSPASLLPDHTAVCSAPEAAGLVQTYDLALEANSAHFDSSELVLTPAAAHWGSKTWVRAGVRRDSTEQMAVSGAQLEGGEHVSTGWAFSRHFLWWWLTAKAAAIALNFSAPFRASCRTPQLCLWPSHHPQKVIFNMDWFPDQSPLSSANTVLAQLARMNWGGTRGKTGGSGSTTESSSPKGPAQESPLLPSQQPTNFPGEWNSLVISPTTRFFFFFPPCCLKKVFNCSILCVGVILDLTS